MNPGAVGDGRCESELLIQQLPVASSTKCLQRPSGTKILQTHSVKHSPLDLKLLGFMYNS